MLLRDANLSAIGRGVRERDGPSPAVERADRGIAGTGGILSLDDRGWSSESLFLSRKKRRFLETEDDER